MCLLGGHIKEGWGKDTNAKRGGGILKYTIMIVDDQKVNRRILGKLLEEKYEIIYAENGKLALELLRTYSDLIAVVLLDLMMPVMDGYEVLKVMRKDSVLSKIPVIVSTQMDDNQTELQALSMGAQDYITKPYKGDIILHRLENIIRFRETAAMINKVQKDELTGLYNKQFFHEIVRDKLKSMPEENFDILCIGVERFKLINEIYGERKGDEVLCHIANILRDTCRTYNICGRFLGDEFYALIPHIENRGTEVIKTMFKKVNEFPIDMNIKLHCGIYAIVDTTISIGAMCDRAKIAANENRGKYDTFFTIYDDSIRQRLLDEQFISNNMQAALDENQFQVYYQPKYDLNTEAIAGAEALVRWIHPEKGFLSPGSFIPVFEQNGFIAQLDYYVWERVCKDLRIWMDKGNSLVAVSVNVSRVDLFNRQLPNILMDLITKYDIPQQYFHLEITESAYSENTEQVINIVGSLRELGFIIEMDDFGSGYSSLNILAEMPVDILKLDMMFLQNQSETTSKKRILEFIMNLARWMKLSVIAEGVETEEQIKMLRSIGCNYVQGYYFAKPMIKSEFEALLSESSTIDMISSNLDFGEKLDLLWDQGEFTEEKLEIYVEFLKSYFDIVRVVDPKKTAVLDVGCEGQGCNRHSCFSVWGKNTRCSNCISMRALEEHGKFNKLEYSDEGLFFVISKYLPYKEHGVIMEMVTKLEKKYVDHVFDKSMLYIRLDELNHQLEMDPLTGVYNRRHIEMYLKPFMDSARENKKDIGIAMVDIDHFKELNDAYGHQAGDEILKNVAKVMEDNIALSRGDFVARYGGDEFMIMCWDIPPKVFVQRISEVIGQVKNMEFKDLGAINVGISAGCVNTSEFPDKDINTMIKIADERLYQAKKAGKGRVISEGE